MHDSGMIPRLTGIGIKHLENSENLSWHQNRSGINNFLLESQLESGFQSKLGMGIKTLVESCIAVLDSLCKFGHHGALLSCGCSHKIFNEENHTRPARHKILGGFKCRCTLNFFLVFWGYIFPRVLGVHT